MGTSRRQGWAVVVVVVVGLLSVGLASPAQASDKRIWTVTDQPMLDRLVATWHGSLRVRPDKGAVLVIAQRPRYRGCKAGKIYLYGPEPVAEVTGKARVIAVGNAQITRVTGGKVKATDNVRIATVSAGKVKAQKDAQINSVVGGQVKATDKSQIAAVSGGWVNAKNWAKIDAVSGGTVRAKDDSTVRHISGGHVWGLGRAQLWVSGTSIAPIAATYDWSTYGFEPAE